MIPPLLTLEATHRAAAGLCLLVWGTWPLICVAVLLFVTADALMGADSQGRGYTSRACGMDLDDDGIIGEASDCDICDGTSGTGVQAVDYDGDGTTEGEVYVDDGGTDGASCGGPSDPCLTIAYALANRLGTQAGEDALCLSGTFDITTSIEMEAGDAGERTITAADPYEWDRKRPTNPLIIMGADSDNDGEYPPHDADDEAIITNSTDTQIFWLRENDSRIEWAHLEQSEASGNTFFHPSTSSGSGGTHYLYVHDWELTNMQDADWWSLNRSSCDGGTTYVEIDNLNVVEMTDTAGGAVAFLLRGNPTNCADLSRYYTLSHVTALHNWGTGEGVVNLFDVWGSEAAGHAVEDSQLYIQIVSNHKTTNQNTTGMPNTALGTIAQGSSFWVVRDNFVDGDNSGVVVEHSDTGFTAGSPMTDLVIDRNEFWLMNDQGDKDTFGVNILDDGGNADNTLVDLTITNNVFWCRDAGKATDRGTAIYAQLGLDSTIPEGYELRIEGNTVDECERNGFLWIDDQGRTNEWETIEVHNNTITDLDSLNLNIDYEPDGWNGSENAWDTTSNGYYFDSADRTLAVMKSTYGEAASSEECATTYTDGPNGDFSLDASDTCSRGTGVATTSPLDLRGETRSTPYDRGALAFSVAAEAALRFLPFVRDDL